MAKLQPRKTKKIKLKTVEGGEVECYTTFTAGDVEEITNAKAGSVITPLRLIIKDWNLENSDGVKLQVNDANVKLLDIRDVNYIMAELDIDKSSFLDETQTETG